MPIFLLYKHSAHHSGWAMKCPINIWMKGRGKKSERTEGKGRERKKEGKHNRLKIGRNIVGREEKSGEKRKKWVFWIPTSPKQNLGLSWPWEKKRISKFLQNMHLDRNSLLFNGEYKRVGDAMFYKLSHWIILIAKGTEWKCPEASTTRRVKFLLSPWIYLKNSWKFYFYS